MCRWDLLSKQSARQYIETGWLCVTLYWWNISLSQRNDKGSLWLKCQEDKTDFKVTTSPHAEDEWTVLQIWYCEKCENECVLMLQLKWMRRHRSSNYTMTNLEQAAGEELRRNICFSPNWSMQIKSLNSIRPVVKKSVQRHFSFRLLMNLKLLPRCVSDNTSHQLYKERNLCMFRIWCLPSVFSASAKPTSTNMSYFFFSSILSGLPEGLVIRDRLGQTDWCLTRVFPTGSPAAARKSFTLRPRRWSTQTPDGSLLRLKALLGLFL